MHSTSTISLDTEALRSNIKFIRSCLKNNVTFSSVVKGNAYGHGIETFVPLVESCGIDHFSVFSADEAIRVHNVVSGKSTILIMGELSDHDMEWAIRKGIEFFVFDIERVEVALATAKRIGIPARIHIEVETGLNRTGFNMRCLRPVVSLLKVNTDFLQVRGVCTHFAGAESVANYLRIQKQIRRYNRLYEWLQEQGIDPGMKHTACSAAAMVYPRTQMDMVRIGILQYGFWPSKEVFIEYLGKLRGKDKIDPLRRVITWSSYIMTIKEVKTGEFIGYGTSFLAQQDITIAIIPVGYSQGYSRALSNQGRVVINGRRARVIGMVNMNMMMVDVTDVPDVSRGNNVILIGGEGQAAVSVASFGELSNQLNYELLTRLPLDIPRLTK